MNIARIILPLSTLASLTSDDPLTKVLGRSQSSHEPVLVYDQKSKAFLGVAYPYNILYRRRPVLNALVSHTVLSPPVLTADTEDLTVLHHMISMRLYSIPVFDKNHKPTGVVQIKRVIRQILAERNSVGKIAASIPILKPYIVHESLKIKDIYARMRKGKAGRTVVVSGDGQLSGIITRRDIYLALLSPAPRERYKAKGGSRPSAFFDRNWPTHMDYPVRTYMSGEVLHTEESEPKSAMVKALLASDKNSLVITDANRKPTGIITTRTVGATILGNVPADGTPITVTDKNKILDAFRRTEMEDMMRSFVYKLSSRIPLRRLELVIEPIRQNRKSVKGYDTKLEAMLDNGKILTSHSRQFRLRAAVNDSEHNLMRQVVDGNRS